MNQRNQALLGQLAYAKIVYRLANIGIIAMTLSYILYITGYPKPFLPIGKLIQLWEKRSTEFIEITQMPLGFDLIHHLSQSDVISLISIIFVSSITIVGYINMLPYFIKENDLPYTLIIVFQIIVFILAACGILSFGDH